MSAPTELKWLIWSNEHNAWWRPDHAGYTAKREHAGRYSWEAAMEILYHANFDCPNKPNEALVPAVTFELGERH